LQVSGWLVATVGHQPANLSNSGNFSGISLTHRNLPPYNWESEDVPYFGFLSESEVAEDAGNDWPCGTVERVRIFKDGWTPARCRLDGLAQECDHHVSAVAEKE